MNHEKCMFLVHLGVIFGYMVSKEGKLPNLKKNLVIVHMPTLKTPKDIQVFNGMAQYYKCFIKDFDFIMAPITKLLWKTKAFKWMATCQQGRNQAVIHECTDLDFIALGHRVSCLDKDF